MKIRHNVPVHLIAPSDPVMPDYQAEVDQTMARAQSAHHRAEKRLRSAERRLARVQAIPVRVESRRAAIERAEALVELRRVELEQLHRLMVSTGFPSTARGRKSFRPVPNPGGPL